MTERERLLLREAFRLAGSVCEAVWPNWGAVPFPILLVREDREFLVRYPPPPPRGFRPGKFDPALGSSVYSRKRTFPSNLLATFPAFGPIPVVVVGTPETTGKTPTEWVLTVLHEHFHQFQMMAPGYFEAVQQLQPAAGDPSGQWMLNYPFPYDDPSIGRSMALLGKRLSRLLKTTPLDRDTIIVFWQRYRDFVRRLPPADYQYASFQLWQEGVARYVELHTAERAARTYRPTPEFQKLHGSAPFAQVAQRLRQGILGQLEDIRLKREQRVAFYALGAGMAMLLDRIGVPWKHRYHQERFYLERYTDVIIPVRYIADRCIVRPVTVTGRALELLADTAGGLFFTPEAVQRLGLTAGAKLDDTPVVAWPDFRPQAWIPPPGTMNGRMPVYNPSTQERKRWSHEPFHLDGILGPRWFAGRVWTLDYPHQRLILHMSGVVPGTAGRSVPLAFKTDSKGKRLFHFPRIQVHIDGQALPMLLDTGATVILTQEALKRLNDGSPRARATSFITASVFDRWRKHHPDWRVIPDAEEGTGQPLIEVPAVTVAGYVVGPVWFTRRPDRAFHTFMAQWMDQRAEGAIGGNVLRFFRIILDYPHAMAYFSRL